MINLKHFTIFVFAFVVTMILLNRFYFAWVLWYTYAMTNQLSDEPEQIEVEDEPEELEDDLDGIM